MKKNDLPSGWRVVELGDVVEIQYGKDHKKLKKGVVPCYGIGGIMRYVEKEIYNQESILLPRKGSLNNIYHVRKPFWTVDTLFWTQINSDKVFTQYLFYSLSKLDLSLLNVGSAVPSLTMPVLSGIKINLPPLPEQKAIAHILGKLDDKIELNRQINQTLETMAQTLFKSWFVNFDPVIDNALKAGNPIPDSLKTQAEKRKTTQSTLPKTTQNLFPNRFVFNNKLKKWIPEGWEVKNFGEVSKCFDSKRIPLSKKQRESKKPSKYPYYGATSINDHINDYIFDDTYLLLGEDGSVIKENNTPFTQYVWGKIWVETFA